MPTESHTRTAKAGLIIRNARIIDGVGGPSVQGDVAINDDRIVAVGDLATLQAGLEIDASGKALAPGFIDVHTHDDRALLCEAVLDCKSSQGVTTVVAGNCGISLAPLSLSGRPPPPLDLVGEDGELFFAAFGDYLQALDENPPIVNALCQVGHSSLRAGAMDSLDRPASATEIRQMRARLEAALEAGAAGMSTGLHYAPARAATTDEVVELASALSACGAIHSTHMRDEGAGVLDSLAETFDIGARAGVPVVISHHKCSGTRNHGRSTETLPVIESARKRQSIALDAYPYVAGSTVLQHDTAREASRVIVTWSRAQPEAAGRDLSELAAEMGCSEAQAIDRLQPAGAIYFMMDEADVRRILSYPHTMIGSDGLPHDEFPHPRLWGTFPRVLGHYARDIGLFSLEEAVRRMTSSPAARFGLKDRGVIRESAFADLVLFDPQTIIDSATFEAPTTPAAGIEWTMVNGRMVWRDGEATRDRPGRAIRLQSLHNVGADGPTA
ncbi:MAG: N-acyl-D-amino-acid deacylase family protein [Gammaproteobacteria bacterium]